MLSSISCREIPNRLIKLQRQGFMVLATTGYLAICMAIGACIHWYQHRPEEELQARYTMPMLQTEEDDIRALIEDVDEGEPETIVCGLRHGRDNMAAKKSTFYSIGSCASYHWPWIELKKRKQQIIL